MSSACSHKKRQKVEETIVCADCGLVLERADFVYEDENAFQTRSEFGASKKVIISNLDERNHLLHQLCRSICQGFNLPDLVRERASLLLDEAIGRGLVNRGAKGRKALLAIIYHLCRVPSSKQPISLAELAQVIGESSRDLFQMVAEMRPLVLHQVGSLSGHDPALFVEKHVSILVEKTEELGQLDIPKTVRMAEELCRLASDHSLVEGRKVETLSLACSVIAVDHVTHRTRKAKEQKEYLKLAAKTVGLAPDTLQERWEELIRAMMSVINSDPFLAPLRQKIKKTTVVLALEDVLRSHLMTKDTTIAPPLSFIRGERKTASMKRQIEAAKARLARSNTASDTTQLKIDDIVIERLLLLGVPEPRIEETHSLGQLFSLEEEFSMSHPDDLSSD